MTWRFEAQDAKYNPFPDYVFKLVYVHYAEDDIPMDTFLYKENGSLRLPIEGWESLKSMLKQHDGVEIVEK